MDLALNDDDFPTHVSNSNQAHVVLSEMYVSVNSDADQGRFLFFLYRYVRRRRCRATDKARDRNAMKSKFHSKKTIDENNWQSHLLPCAPHNQLRASRLHGSTALLCYYYTQNQSKVSIYLRHAYAYYTRIPLQPTDGG